jgi:hypothetical protein
MKLSDLELSAYDLVVIILPGCICIAEVGITVYGLVPFWEWASNISLSAAAILALTAFGVGHLINQAAYEFAVLLRGPRVIRRGRDIYWQKNAPMIRSRLLKVHKVETPGGEKHVCDRTFNHCLTVIGSAFEKRKVFTLVSALSLSLWLLSVTALIPVVRIFYLRYPDWQSHIYGFLALSVMCLAGSFFAWRRCQLYSDLADVTVFHIFEAFNPTENLKLESSLPITSEEPSDE